jgi:hypothetical protein
MNKWLHEDGEFIRTNKFHHISVSIVNVVNEVKGRMRPAYSPILCLDLVIASGEFANSVLGLKRYTLQRGEFLKQGCLLTDA